MSDPQVRRTSTQIVATPPARMRIPLAWPLTLVAARRHSSAGCAGSGPGAVLPGAVHAAGDSGATGRRAVRLRDRRRRSLPLSGGWGVRRSGVRADGARPDWHGSSGPLVATCSPSRSPPRWWAGSPNGDTSSAAWSDRWPG